MRSFLIAFAGLTLFATGRAQAKMPSPSTRMRDETVAVDGVERYQWRCRPAFRRTRPERRLPHPMGRPLLQGFDDAPMPNSIFFTKIGHAIHGTDFEGRLGTPASTAACGVRSNAATLYAWSRKMRVNTTVDAHRFPNRPGGTRGRRYRRRRAPLRICSRLQRRRRRSVVLAPQLRAPQIHRCAPRVFAPLPQPQVQQLKCSGPRRLIYRRTAARTWRAIRAAQFPAPLR